MKNLYTFLIIVTLTLSNVCYAGDTPHDSTPELRLAMTNPVKDEIHAPHDLKPTEILHKTIGRGVNNLTTMVWNLPGAVWHLIYRPTHSTLSPDEISPSLERALELVNSNSAE